MDFIKRMAVLIYVTLILFIGSFLVLFSTGWLSPDQVFDALKAIFADEQLRAIFGGVGAFLLVINFIFYQIYSVNVHRDKIIAFDNPSGRVSVSLMALEDLVRRKMMQIDEIKEVKPNIKATRKGLQVSIKMMLKTEVSIPEISSKVQSQVKDKIHDLIGLEETVSVSIYVNKILPDHSSDNKKKDKPLKKIQEPAEAPVPFRGYRA